MPDPDRYSPEDVLARLRFVLDKPVDFQASDPEATADKVRILTAAATYFNVLAVGQFGGRLGPARDPMLVEQVVAAAFQMFAGTDPHPGPFDKAAMLLRGITQGHPFQDGNKRTGFLTATYYLARVGYDLSLDLDTSEVIAFCRGVSAGDIRSVDMMAEMLARWSVSRTA